MFIVWGTKVVRKVRGRTADFCRLCRDFRPHRGVEVLSVAHIYYIPLGRRQAHGFEMTCESCGLLHAMPATLGRPALLRDGLADVETLISQTNPQGRSKWADRLAFEERARAGTLSSEERPTALLEPFLLADSLLENRMKARRFDRLSGLAFVMTFVGFFATLGIGTSYLRSNHRETLNAAFAVGGFFALVTLVLAASSVRRYARRELLPVIARSLGPLRPNRGEIATAIERLKEARVRIGRVLQADDVIDALGFV
jgi:hypothetical protein